MRLPSATRCTSSIAATALRGSWSAEEAGRVAAAAQVKTLVLSHLAPADDAAITDTMWIEAARQRFAGNIVVARDGMEL